MQRASKKLHLSDGQRVLALIRRGTSRPVSPEVVQSQKDMVAAFNLAVNVCGLEEKEIYVALGIDSSHWSRMRDGKSHFPLNKIEDFCDIVGNEILLEFFAWRRGKGLHVLETESARLLREEKEAHAKTQERLNYLETLHVRK